ncbi:MAG: aldehyde dehydrogenase family protein [Spirochaetia bacterium]|nr:aldehyde dehydrogenase family protein [Spirochaetia bacterium]
MEKSNETELYISSLIDRAKAAQNVYKEAEQITVDRIVAKVAWKAVQPEFVKSLAEKLVNESGLGFAPDKEAKIHSKVRGALRDMKGQITTGIVERNSTIGIVKIAKPMGVIGALAPVTNGEATPLVKALFSLKTRNAIVIAPHPKAVDTNTMAVNLIRSVLKEEGLPEDLVIGVEKVSVAGSQALLRMCDMNLATGGAAMVKEAYSSGTPSQGVGAGNAVTVIDDTVNLTDVADKIKRSKTFDYATSCSTENSCVIQESIYQDMVKELENAGGYLCNTEEKKKLQEAMWDKESHGALNRAIVAKSASRIAELAGIILPEKKSFIMVEEEGVGPDFPFSGEKLSVTTALYKYKEFDDAIDLVNRITSYSGAGHSCGIHSKDDSRIEKLSFSVNVSRVMVCQPQCLANSGAWTNGMPMSLTLGCGSWGGNSTTENVTWKHLLNYTWISYPVDINKPTDKELFGEFIEM